jgi:hypothetical protein
MAESGWDIAMKHIDDAFDIPQFVASALVRKIAANGFRLPTADRAKFQKLPDAVIARIEDIVREAYLEAGEDVGGDISSEDIWQQALTSRREMIASGELISEDDFRQRIGLTQRSLSKLLADDSVFTMTIDDVQYFPALLAEPTQNGKRLQEICRIIEPAPPDSRLDFLTSRRGSLGERRPLDMMESDEDFESLRRLAKGWTAEWWRTAVKMYRGEYEVAPANAEPLYTAAAELDPRRPLWERASEALHAHGYEWPLGPYPDVRNFSLFVERQAAGHSAPIHEACVQIAVGGERIRIRIVAAPGTALHSETVLSSKTKSFIEVAKRVISHLVAMSAGR